MDEVRERIVLIAISSAPALAPDELSAKYTPRKLSMKREIITVENLRKTHSC